MGVVGFARWVDRESLQFFCRMIFALFNGPNAAPPIIDDIELIAGVARVVILEGTETIDGQSKRVVILATGNKNVFPGYAKGNPARATPEEF